MTDIGETVAPVLVPHSRFLECRERRLAIAAAFTQQAASPAVEAEFLPPAIAIGELRAVAVPHSERRRSIDV